MIREEAAALAARLDVDHLGNGEEAEFRNAAGLNYIANYSKGLHHNTLGEVVPGDYQALLRALYSGNPDHFEQIPLGTAGGRKLTNPQAGLAFDLEGPDAQSLTIPPAPRIDSPEVSGEMAELYWMALCRDIHFNAYTAATPLITQAATSLSEPSVGGEISHFRGPKVGNAVTPATLFRGVGPGVLDGPYLSQFLLKDIPYGTLLVEQRQLTVNAGTDFLTTFPAWLNAQNGVPLSPISQPVPGPQRRYIRNLRDLATYVHFDALYEAYLNACLILLAMTPPKPPFDPGNPYVHSLKQDGFGTFGGPHILSLVTEVATRALKAVWFQKWGVHRRLRPEEFGGRIHVHLVQNPGRYPMIDGEILNSLQAGALSAHFPGGFGTFLLPQAFAEGCPLHPAYGAGHATVAGACVTILKAWFDESFVIPNPQVPNNAGTALQAAPPGPPLTVGGELNKLAANIALGRNGAGVHWRSDYTESITLGEAIAIGILEEQNLTYNEDYYLTLTKFDGSAITIGR